MADIVDPDRPDKRGYLLEPFRIFCLDSRNEDPIPSHYHEFHKVILMLSGGVTYRIEGHGYRLRSGDILLVPAHAIHQPEINPRLNYRRIVLWIQPQALTRFGLDTCFSLCRSGWSCLLPREKSNQDLLSSLTDQLQACCREQDFADDALAEALFHQLMVHINRWILLTDPDKPETVQSDPRIDDILDYISLHLTENEKLTLEAISSRIYLSRSWLMHRFKEVVGCSLHQYILQKRLILAAQALRRGASVQDACFDSGFSDYSSFLRAFRKTYGVAPSDF